MSMNDKFECKACGGELEIIEEGVGRCTYCACKQPIPRDNEALFNRANQLRMQNKDFEEAYKIYKELLVDLEKDPEVYWGMLLCRFGIEYVKDNNGEYLPTCHRTIQTSILQDTDYLKTLEYADGMAIDYYKAQGKLIEEYQKKIKILVAGEDPYDVFISFKATDVNGYPTKDARIGKEIYDYLTQKCKLKVFFSNITLQNRLGEEFEPIIYSALKTSKVMVLVASNLENINSTWLKNEWSRYIDMIEEARKENRKKRLIPALIDMKIEELPSELISFQGININNISAIEILCKSIDTFIGDERIKYNEDKLNNMGNIDEKLYVSIKYAERKLQEEQYGEAYSIFREVVEQDETIAVAHWGMLLATNKKKNDNELSSTPIAELDAYEAYKKAYEYADDNRKNYYEDILQKCKKMYEVSQYPKKHKKDIDDIIFKYRYFNSDTHVSDSSKKYIKEYYEECDRLKMIIKRYLTPMYEYWHHDDNDDTDNIIYGIGAVVVAICVIALLCFLKINVACIIFTVMIPFLVIYGYCMYDRYLIGEKGNKLLNRCEEKAKLDKGYQEGINKLPFVFEKLKKGCIKEIDDYCTEFKAKYNYDIGDNEKETIKSEIFPDSIIKKKIDNDIRRIWGQAIEEAKEK